MELQGIPKGERTETFYVSGPVYGHRMGPVSTLHWALGFFNEMIQLSVHLGCAMAICFCHFPFKRHFQRGEPTLWISFFILLSLSIPVYLILNFERVSTRMPFVDGVTPPDLFFGVCLVVLLLRHAGERRVSLYLWWLFVFIAYGFLGPLIPGGTQPQGYSFFPIYRSSTPFI